MSDAQLLDLIASTYGAPRLVDGDRKFILAGDGLVLVLERVGKGDRWALGSSGIVRLEDGMVPQAVAYRFSLAALRWVYRGVRMNFAAHARAMGARVL